MSTSVRYFGYAIAGIVIGGALGSACSAADDGGGGNGAGATGGSAPLGGTGGIDASSGGSGGSAAQDGGGTGGINLDGSLNDGKIDPDAACDLQTYKATITKAPVDVIFLVDNSCSMAEEMKAIQDNINVNFAQIIASSGIDYRVILVGEHGAYDQPIYESSICIGPPLGGAPCTNVQANTAPVNNPPVFYHYDHDDVESNDAWCKMLDWYKKPDRYNLAPGGWGEWLRKEALKTFVLVTDDRMDCTWPSTASLYPSCSANGTKCYDDGTTSTYPTQAVAAAQAFDQDILSLDPVQFGTAQSRNYVWHSLAGVPKNTASATGEYQPSDPIVPYSTKCTTAVNSGPGTQALSILTGGLRYPVCEGLGFDVVFKKIADGVIQGAKIQCDFPMPAPPAGKELDPKTIQIQYTPSQGGSPEKFQQVKDATECKPGAFYIEPGVDGGADAGDGGGNDRLVLCADACKKVQGDDSANIEILALCKSGGPI